MAAIFAKLVSLFLSVLMMVLNLFVGTPVIPEPPEVPDLPEIPENVTVDDPAVIAEYYNLAVAATIEEDENGISYVPEGNMSMTLAEQIKGDGAIGAILEVLQPTVDRALKNNSREIDWLPGAKRGELLASDILDCAAISENGKTTLIILLKEQVDGSDCDADTAGPVARGIGTLGSIDGALQELGAEIVSGRDTIRLTYKNAYITCVIDEETGRIISGDWAYTVDVFIGNIKAKLGIAANLKNITASIDYKVSLGK